MYALLLYFTLLLVLCGSKAEVHFRFPSLADDFGGLENDTVVYSLIAPPWRGSLFVNGTGVEVSDTPFADDEWSGVTYTPLAQYEFNVIAGGDCTSYTYDEFKVNATVFFITNESDFHVGSFSYNVTLCIEDEQNVPVANDLNVTVASTTPSSVIVNLTVVDGDDYQTGLGDGLGSTFTFHDDSGSVSTGAGIVFNQVSISIGKLVDCGTGDDLVADQTYEATVFCFESNSVEGTGNVTYYPVDKAGGEGEAKYIAFQTRQFIVCTEEERCTSHGVDTVNRTLMNVTDVPYDSISLTDFPYVLRIVSLPLHGTLYTNVTVEPEEDGAEDDLGFLYDDGNNVGLRRVKLGDTFTPGAVTFHYLNNQDYFNRYHYSDYGYYSVLHPDDTPIIDDCDDEVNGCPDYFTYILVSDEDENGVGDDIEGEAAPPSGYVTVSPIGEIKLVVDRVIQTEQLSTCPLNTLSNWPTEACISYGMENSTIPIFLAGKDGRRSPPAYKMIITSLPTEGVLYHNLRDDVNPILGDPVEIGDEVGTPNELTTASLVYVGPVGYFTRLAYRVYPLDYYSSIDEAGEYVGGCTEETIEDGSCSDSFKYKVKSGVNDSIISAEDTYRIVVGREATGQLTVCPEDGFSGFNTSCLSLGYESNDYKGDQAIPIYFNVNNTNGDEIQYRILTLPSSGTLYLNAGNATKLEYDNDTVIEANMILEIDPLKGENFPYLIYVGDPDYYNAIFNAVAGTTVTVNQLGEPIQNCPASLSIMPGCPDSFQFRAETIDGTRKSNPGTYSILVYSLTSDETFDGPDEIQFEVGTRFYFTGDYAITYTCAEKDAFIEHVRMKTYIGNVGFSGSMVNITFPPGDASCFNTTGCNGMVRFIAPCSIIQYVYGNLFFDSDEAIKSYSGDRIFSSIYKLEDENFTPENAFEAELPTIEYKKDILIFSEEAEYEYEVPDDGDGGDGGDDGEGDEATEEEDEVDRANRAKSDGMWFIVALTVGGICLLFMFAVTVMASLYIYDWWQILKTPAYTPIDDDDDTGDVEEMQRMDGNDIEQGMHGRIIAPPIDKEDAFIPGPRKRPQPGSFTNRPNFTVIGPPV